MFEKLIIPLIEGAFIVFGNIRCFGEYMIQPVSRLGESFTSSYSNFQGIQIAFSMPEVPVVDVIGDFIAKMSQDTPIWVALTVLCITLGLLTSIIRHLIIMIVSKK